MLVHHSMEYSIYSIKNFNINLLRVTSFICIRGHIKLVSRNLIILHQMNHKL